SRQATGLRRSSAPALVFLSQRIEEGPVRILHRFAALLGVVGLLFGAPAAAQGGSVLLGPEHRWSERNVFERTALDVVAIPANLGRWDSRDWLQLAGWTGAVGVLMFAGEPSADVRLNRWIAMELDG